MLKGTVSVVGNHICPLVGSLCSHFGQLIDLIVHMFFLPALLSSSVVFQVASEKESTLKRKNLLPSGAESAFSIDFFSESRMKTILTVVSHESVSVPLKHFRFSQVVRINN